MKYKKYIPFEATGWAVVPFAETLVLSYNLSNELQANRLFKRNNSLIALHFLITENIYSFIYLQMVRQTLCKIKF